jgi:hypothetical protein
MAHLDFKARLDGPEHAATIASALRDLGAVPFFAGRERDNIYRTDDHLFVKCRYISGLISDAWLLDTASNELAGLNAGGDMVPVDQTMHITYRRGHDTPTPHYITAVDTGLSRRMQKKLFADNLYATVQKERRVYWLSLHDAPQGGAARPLRIHIDHVDTGEKHWFLEVEAKLHNDTLDPARIDTAKRDLRQLSDLLSIGNERITHASYADMARGFALNGLDVTCGWINHVPFDLLHDMGRAPRRNFAPDAPLLRDRAVNDGSYLLLNGGVRVDYAGQSYGFNKHYMVGELATLNETGRRSGSVTATGPVNALYLNTELTHTLAQKTPIRAAWLERYMPL